MSACKKEKQQYFKCNRGTKYSEQADIKLSTRTFICGHRAAVKLV